jgi:hypothetical protein
MISSQNQISGDLNHTASLMAISGLQRIFEGYRAGVVKTLCHVPQNFGNATAACITNVKNAILSDGTENTSRAKTTILAPADYATNSYLNHKPS